MQQLDDARLDLLCEQAIYGLTEKELQELEREGLGAEFRSLELTAAAVNMAGVGEYEAMPEHLMSKIAASAAPWVGENAASQQNVFTAPRKAVQTEPEPKSSIWNWLGWAVAAAACVALAFNVFTTQRSGGPQLAGNPTPAPTQPAAKPSIAELREQLIASGADIKRATWGKGTVKEIEEISGDVVWSDTKQEGYMRFRGLPKNDPSKETYQLWIFEDGKLEPHPKDGGVFDVTAEGEVIVPIDPKLVTKEPKVFAITIEKPGGVVVSKREKIAALAKTETASS